MNSSELIDLYIIKYLSDEINASEKEKLDVWVRASKENERYFIRMVKIWEQSIIHLQKESSVEEYFIRFQQLLQRRKMYKIVYRVSSVAAIVLVLLAIHIFVIPSFDNPLLTETTVNQKKEVILPDSSIVWLNKNSKLEYHKRFAHNRNVRLTGEAYFNVTPDKKYPFTVNSSEIAIKVLGTEFSVINNLDEIVSETAIKTGCVHFTSLKTGKEMYLYPGQMVSYNKVLGNMELKMVDTVNFARWANDYLVFENTLLKEVFTQLEKWYCISIVCANPNILNTPVTFIVDSETKEEILNNLRVVVPFVWREQKNSNKKLTTIIISPMIDEDS